MTRALLALLFLPALAHADECRPPLLCPTKPEPVTARPAPIVVKHVEPCTHVGVCCQWHGLKFQCGFHWDCKGRREITITDGNVTARGECR